MDNPTPVSLVRRFVGYVNAGDQDGVNALIAEDVLFTDIQGEVYQEKDFMANYMVNFPDYKIHINHVLQGGDGVAIVGQTSGSHVSPEIEENEILVWIMELRGGLIAEWRVYADEGYAGR